MDNKQKIINYLGKNFGKNFTMHNLSKLLQIPYASFHRTIKCMSDILYLENVGKSKIVSLNINNPVIKSYLIISSYEEQKVFIKKHPIIKKILNELNTKDIVILFGSYAKFKETDKSDLDILIINKDGKKSLNFSKYELLFKKTINPIFITQIEFINMLRENEENIGKQALKSHIILNNPEKFWGLVLNGI